MLSWRRKSDGFEWHKHVRTTVKLRRANRRRAIEDAKVAAVGGVKVAGKASAALSRSAASTAGEWALAALAAARDGLTRLAVALPPAAAWAWSRGRDELRALCPLLMRKGVQPILALIAILAGMVLALRAPLEGLAAGTVLAALVAVIAAALAALPVVLGGQSLAGAGAAVMPWLKRRIALLPVPEVLRNSRGARWAMLGAAVVLLAGAALSAGWLLWRGTVQLATMAGIPGLSARTVEGRATALSGDTLRVGETVVRLAGIEAPLRNQRCARAGNRRWRCGEAARDALARSLRGAPVACTLTGADDAGRMLGACRSRNQDVAEALVREGHVFAAAGLFSSYASQEKAARAEKRGLWRGEAERPSEMRAKDAAERGRDWEEARRAAPNGCPIKGQVVSGRRFYVVPGSADYDRIRIRARRGERWFCTEQEAAAAGWKPSPRS